MIQRKLTDSLKKMAELYPIVTLVGPRQSGKTTLAKETFPGYTYVNLERLETRRFAKDDPKGFFESFPPPLIVDEVQNCPDLLSEIQVLSDSLGSKGSFILTGSQQLSLMEGGTQSLAGRTALLTLWPLSLQELAAASICKGRDEAILWGVMWGGTSKTIGEWVTLLETSNIIFKLRPWFGNLGKRLIKSPKIYFTDTGLASMLLGIENTQQLARDPLLGNLFENLVVEMMKAVLNENRMTEFYYFRTDTGVEVDLLYKSADQWNCVEVKAASTVNTEFFKNMEKLSKLPGFEGLCKNLVYSGDNLKNYKGVRCCSYADVNSLF